MRVEGESVSGGLGVHSAGARERPGGGGRAGGRAAAVERRWRSRAARRLVVQRDDPRADDRGAARRHARRAPDQPARRADDDPLARAAAAGGDGRNPGRAASRAAGRDDSSTASRCPTPARSGTTRTPTRRCRSSAGSTARSSCAATDEPVVDGERVLVFDDVKLDAAGRSRSRRLFDRHDGRQGNVRLHQRPQRAGATRSRRARSSAGASSTPRARATSDSRSAGAPFRIIGSDGGLIETPVEATEMLLAARRPRRARRRPVRVEAAGARDRVAASPPHHARRGSRAVSGPCASAPRGRPVAAIPQTPAHDRAAGPRRRDARPYARGSRSAPEPLATGTRLHHQRRDATTTTRRCKVGELQVWDDRQQTRMDHPFHLHGFFFQVVAIDGKAPDVPRRGRTPSTCRRRTRVTIACLPDDRPGSWMYHCHILEHHAAGMMGHFDVVRGG